MLFATAYHDRIGSERMLEEAGTTDYRTLVTIPGGLKAVTIWSE